MTETDRRFHETWLGMVQPTDGLVVSIPVLVDHQCMRRAPAELQARLRELCPERPLPHDAQRLAPLHQARPATSKPAPSSPTAASPLA